jgi:centromeric protein E
MLTATGLSKRSLGSTAMNQQSSRSHTIFKITVESRVREKVADEEQRQERGSKLSASLTLVDLAGSEGAKHTNASGQRAQEGKSINKSLLALGNVINARSKGCEPTSYRDSVLTRLLKASLSGDAKMAIVCCITPSDK